MKKYLFILTALFLTTTILAQDKYRLIGDITPKAESEKGYYGQMKADINSCAVYIKNNKPIEVKTVYINILDNKYSNESFELKIISAPPMNSGQIYKKNEFVLLNSEVIICQAKSGGVMKIDVEKYNISTSENFIIEMAPTEETKKKYTFCRREDYDRRCSLWNS